MDCHLNCHGELNTLVALSPVIAGAFYAGRAKLRAAWAWLRSR